MPSTFHLQRLQEELPAPSGNHQAESETATPDKAELDLIHFLEIKPYLTEKVKKFQAGCIKNHFSAWASNTMDKEILGSTSSSSSEISDKKLPHYTNGIEMRFSSKEEFFLADEIKNLQQKGVIKE